MVWHKASVEAGLVGLEQWEAAQRDLCHEEFQNVSDPMDLPRSTSILVVSFFSNLDF